MDSRDWLILGAVGGVAWWLYHRNSAMPKPALATNPGPSSAFTLSAALSTQSGPALVHGLGAGTSWFNGVAGKLGFTGQSAFRSQANALVAADNSPPLPPAAPNSFFSSFTGIAAPGGRGFSTMGTNPQGQSRIFLQ